MKPDDREKLDELLAFLRLGLKPGEQLDEGLVAAVVEAFDGNAEEPSANSDG